MITLWVFIERCKLFSMIEFLFYIFQNFTFHPSHQNWLWQAHAAWHSSQSVGVYISKTLLQCNNRAQWIPYWSCCKKTNWKHLFTISLDHHVVFSGSPKFKKIKSRVWHKQRQLLVCVFPQYLYVCIHQSRALQ